MRLVSACARMLDRVRLIAIMLAAVLQASIAFGACAQIEGMRLPELDSLTSVNFETLASFAMSSRCVTSTHAFHP